MARINRTLFSIAAKKFSSIEVNLSMNTGLHTGRGKFKLASQKAKKGNVSS